MAVTILVATPHTAFGDLLRTSLEGNGQYQVSLAPSAKEVRACFRSASFHLAILDTALADEPFIPLCMDLLEQQPGIRLVVIPPENNPNHPALGGLIPHGYLSRPFYLPDLLDTISRLLADREKQFQGQPPANAGTAPAALPTAALPSWLREPLILRGYLEKELPATQAIAAVVGLNAPLSAGGSLPKGAPQACAGALSDESIQELTDIVFRYWNRAEKTDLMRFVRVSAEKKDYLVYATQIIGEFVLILVYDTSAPLSQIRPQTKAMAQGMAARPPEGYQANGLPVLSTAPGAPAADGSGIPAQREPETQPLDDLDLDGDFTQPRSDSTAGDSASPSSNPLPAAPAAAFTSLPVNDENNGSFDGGVINLSALLGSVPPPDPERGSPRGANFGGGWLPEQPEMNGFPVLSGGLNGGPSSTDNQPGLNSASSGEADQNSLYGPYLSASDAGPETADTTGNAGEQRGKKRNVRADSFDPQTIPRETLPGGPSLPVDYSLPAGPEIDSKKPPAGARPASLEVKTEPPVIPAGISAPIEPRLSSAGSELTMEPDEEDSISLEDTRPHVVSTISSLGQLEHASPALSLLNYTCVLIPRLPQHYLTGELADRMAIWVQQLCLAFGWRLEGISIRPEYLQWTVQVAPAISPGNLVRIIRQRTSMHVFGSFPHLAEQNPSGDFWATGYLIVSGAQPPSAQLLRDYIAQTRKRQGVNK